jgi:hypothetical protein
MINKRKYKKQVQEGNTNMSYDSWKLWMRLLKNQAIDYNTSW